MLDFSMALGQGWRMGFLGMLHMEVFSQRLEEVSDMTAIFFWWYPICCGWLYRLVCEFSLLNSTPSSSCIFCLSSIECLSDDIKHNFSLQNSIVLGVAALLWLALAMSEDNIDFSVLFGRNFSLKINGLFFCHEIFSSCLRSMMLMSLSLPQVSCTKVRPTSSALVRVDRKVLLSFNVWLLSVHHLCNSISSVESHESTSSHVSLFVIQYSCCCESDASCKCAPPSQYAVEFEWTWR